MKNMTKRPNFGHKEYLIHPIVPTVTVTNPSQTNMQISDVICI